MASRNILVRSLQYGQVLRKVNLSSSARQATVLRQAPIAVNVFARRTLATADSSGHAAKILETARSTITDEVKKEINSVIVFNISGKQYLLEAHESRPLKLEVVEQAPEKVDFTMITDEATFLKLAKGETKPTTAFMTGKMKIKGDMGKAMKAQKLFAALKVTV